MCPVELEIFNEQMKITLYFSLSEALDLYSRKTLVNDSTVMSTVKPKHMITQETLAIGTHEIIY